MSIAVGLSSQPEPQRSSNTNNSNKRSRVILVVASALLGYAIKYIEILVWPAAEFKLACAKEVRETKEVVHVRSHHNNSSVGNNNSITLNSSSSSSSEWPLNTMHPTTPFPSSTPPTAAPSSTPTANDNNNNNALTVIRDDEEIQKAHQQACRDFPESIRAFASELKVDIEHKAFPPWSHTPNNTASSEVVTTTTTTTTQPAVLWAFPGFNKEILRQAFGNKTTAFIGDSTSFYTERWLYRLLVTANMAGEDMDELVGTFPQNYTRVYRILEGATSMYGDRELFQPPLFPSSSSTIFWKGMRGGNGNPCDMDVKHINWNWIQQQRPNIIVAHYGLHMLHAGTETKKGGLNLCRADQFLNYETKFLEQALHVAVQSGTKLLLYKTNNLMCVEKWLGRNDVKKFLENDPSFFQGCRDDMQTRIQSPETNPTNLTFTTEEVDLYCKEAAWTDKALVYLNQKMQAFVKKTKEEQSAKGVYPGLTIEIYSDRDVMSCPYTNMGDGMHYPELQMPRIRLLAHQINCQYKA